MPNGLKLKLAYKNIIFYTIIQLLKSRVDWVMGNYISKLKWAWQAQILSHAFLIWQKCICFWYIQMILLGVFASYIGYRFRKITKEFPFQELQCSLVRCRQLKIFTPIKLYKTVFSLLYPSNVWLELLLIDHFGGQKF